jgi:penicillin amidase
MQQGITVQDMMAMQTDNYNLVAEFLRPLFLKSFPTQSLDTIELAYYDQMNTWNLRNDIHEKGATVFDVYWDQLRHSLIDDEYAKAPQPVQRPLEETLLEALLRDSAFKFIDDINTPTKESLSDLMAAAFHKAAAKLDSINAAGHLEWGSFKDTRINHLTKLPALSRLHLPIGGGVNMINATKPEHGPSWRMVVELTNETQAYGVYPGGQSGNPGSRFYDSFVDQWVAGKYYQLWMMKKSETTDPRVKWTMHFSPAV